MYQAKNACSVDLFIQLLRYISWFTFFPIKNIYFIENMQHPFDINSEVIFQKCET